MDALPAVWFVATSSANSPGSGTSASVEPPNEAARRALVAWAEARGLEIAMPKKSTLKTMAVDLSIAEAVEKELILARDALTRLDADATEEALDRARSKLRAHPELPEAAWLLAEVERGWAARWMRIAPQDPERAARAWQRAASLDGGRAAGIGETAAAKLDDVDVTLVADDAPALLVFVDGTETSLGKRKFSPGEHAVVTERKNRVLWADWVSFAEGEIVRVPTSRPAECSAEDLDSARMRSTDGAMRSSIDASGVACAEWIAVTPIGPSTLRVAMCEKDHCGEWLLWQSHASSLTPVLPQHHRKQKTSPWVAVAAIGLATVMVTAVTLVAVGTFDPAPHETRFVGGGIKTSP